MFKVTGKSIVYSTLFSHSSYCSLMCDCSGDDKDKIPAVTSGALDTFLVCPNCEKEFEMDGDKMPMSLRCGHTFCLGKIYIYVVGRFLSEKAACKIGSIYHIQFLFIDLVLV